LLTNCSDVTRVMTVIVVLEGMGLPCQCLCVDLCGSSMVYIHGNKNIGNNRY